MKKSKKVKHITKKDKNIQQIKVIEQLPVLFVENKTTKPLKVAYNGSMQSFKDLLAKTFVTEFV